MIKKYLKNHIETNVPNKNVAVLMGGGVDAISVALSAHDIGKVVKSIKKGDHVHVHNVKTKKW